MSKTAPVRNTSISSPPSADSGASVPAREALLIVRQTAEAESSAVASPAPPPSRTLATVARWLLIALCAETVYSTAYRSVLLAVGSARLSVLAGVVALACLLAVYRMREAFRRMLARTAHFTPTRFWYPGFLALGIVLRLAWHLAFHTVPRADGLIYFSEARTLVLQHHYDGAFFPPGLPFAEAPLLWLFGPHFRAAASFTLLCFVGTFAVVRLLAMQFSADRRVPAFACALLALWPNDVASVGVNSKESLLALLTPAAFVLYLSAVRRRSHLPAVLAGACVGLAALSQPAFLLFAAVFLVCELLWRTALRGALMRFALLLCGMFLVILPWTARNQRLYHRVVLITANGGSVFYRANNPRANAQYEPQGAEKLTGDEFEASKQGYRAARLWIQQHPLDFTALMIRKQVVYLGDDSDRIYESIKRGQQPRAAVYAGFKSLANLFWMVIYLLLAASSGWLFRRRSWPAWYGVCVLPLLYQWCIDSVFEAGARHHVTYLGLLATLAALAIAQAAGLSTADSDTRHGVPGWQPL